MKWYVDYSGYCEIEANTPEEAREKFWEYISGGDPLPCNYYEIDSVGPMSVEDVLKEL